MTTQIYEKKCVTEFMNAVTKDFIEHQDKRLLPTDSLSVIESNRNRNREWIVGELEPEIGKAEKTAEQNCKPPIDWDTEAGVKAELAALLVTKRAAVEAKAAVLEKTDPDNNLPQYVDWAKAELQESAVQLVLTYLHANRSNPQTT